MIIETWTKAKSYDQDGTHKGVQELYASYTFRGTALLVISLYPPQDVEDEARWRQENLPFAPEGVHALVIGKNIDVPSAEDFATITFHGDIQAQK